MRPVHATENLTSMVHHEVRDAIVAGELGPGELYSINKLAERLGVSRTPVREAMLRLQEEGMVRFERNRGVRILETGVHDLQEIGTLRLLLEVPAAHQAAKRIDGDVVDELVQEMAGMEAAAERGDEVDYMRRDRRFHRLILEASGNRRLAEYVEGLRDLTHLRGASTVGRSRELDEIAKEHRVILERIADRDQPGTADAMRDHLVQTFRLLLSQETSTDPSGIISEWADSGRR